jgi:predicted molibdopterin-dependent oxidoreductase YjgC
VPEPPDEEPRARVGLTIDGRDVEVARGQTVLDACRAAGAEVPALCYLETLTPINACRVCVVEQEGARVLVPACSRAVEPGMNIQTQSRGVGCTLTVHVQDQQIVKVTSPIDNGTTRGNLCVKGRFGFEYVHSEPER